jgi:small subunit ribosomal protein S21
MLIIEVKKSNIETALKQYKRKINKTKQLKKQKDLKHFNKPSVINRLKYEKAKYLQSKDKTY